MNDCRVRLLRASLPAPLGWVAVHQWFTLLDERDGEWQRWEVWQNRDAGGTSWGFLHRDLMAHDGNVGGGPTRVEHEWQGPEASRLAAVLTEPERYPHRERYRAWPGPNSNTYAAWVLREAGIEYRLGARAIGRNYPLG
jgi:hypothetical protein